LLCNGFHAEARRDAEAQSTTFRVELLAPAHRSSPSTTQIVLMVRWRDLSAEQAGKLLLLQWL